MRIADIIVLWAHPRSLSTAFERMMIERGDFKILHEPFAYIYYVLEKKAPAVGMIVDPEHPIQFEDIKNYILKDSHSQPIFLKDMAYHSYEYLMNDEDFLHNLIHTFIIRDPAKSIPSYYFRDPNIIEDEIGYEQQYHLFRKITELFGQIPVLIDADDLQKHPTAILRYYCNRLNIKFIPEALQWEESHDKQWDIWKVWHGDVASSTKISQGAINKYQENVTNNARIRELYEYSLPFYQKMYKYRIVPEPMEIR
ncbi:MAG: hypothetical protein QNJ51_25590 [Calothrix sp. MO_167.B12]|nr:hypothetical protein [Calothrix sp. MO_167.B12]